MAETNNPGENRNAPATKPARTLPDISQCMVERSGIGNLVYCLMHDWYNCAYAERIAFQTFCSHPQWRKILERTEAGR